VERVVLNALEFEQLCHLNSRLRRLARTSCSEKPIHL
jgi:hypothetical protein